MDDTPAAVLYQIFYDDASRENLDPGFTPLDNTSGRRDWHEYWPIRKQLQESKLRDDTFYGFFSPQFGGKTRLGSHDVHAFLASLEDGVDVAIFCPYWDHNALFWNVIEQGEWAHRGITEMTRELWSLVQPGVDPTIPPNTSRNTVYCNYFAARPAFWQRWLDVCEKLFAQAEAGHTEFGKALSDKANYPRPVDYKVFIMERVPSIILANDRSWKSAAFNPFRLGGTHQKTSIYGYQAILSDALKIAFVENGFPEYRNAYFKLRESVKAAIMGREGSDTQTAFCQPLVPSSS